MFAAVVGGGGAPGGSYWDGGQGASRGVEALRPGEALEGPVLAFGLVPVRADLRRGLSRGVRDDPVLHGAMEARARRRYSSRSHRCWGCACRGGGCDAALQQEAAYREVERKSGV